MSEEVAPVGEVESMARKKNRVERARAKRRSLIDSLTPAQREDVARWMESVAAAIPERVAKDKVWLQTHPDDYATRRQIDYWLNYLAAVKHLAYLIRTAGPGGRERPGP